jgi:hypothetical protein
MRAAYRVIARLQPEISLGIRHRMPVARDRQERRVVVAAQLGRQLVDRDADVLLGQGDAVELGALAARDDIGHELGEPRVQSRSRQQVRGQARGDEDLIGLGAPEMVDVHRVVGLHHGAHIGRDRLDGHDRQDRAHIGLVGPIRRKHDRGARLADATALEVVGVGDVAAHEIHAVPARVALAVVEQHDLRRELVALQLLDEVAGGRVPAADDDVVAVARSAHALALLEQEIDDESDDGPGHGGHDGDAEEREHPADDVATEARDVAWIPGADDGGDRPIERAAEARQRERLRLEQRDRHRRDHHEADDGRQQGREEVPVHLAADAPGVKAQTPQERCGEQRP